MIDFVYITSASHSGSTLLTMLLACHPDVASVGETCAVLYHRQGDTGYCSCGALVRECAFWNRVGEGMRERGVDWESPDFQVEFRTPGRRWTDRVLRAEYRGLFLEAVRDAFLFLSPAWRAKSPSVFRANRALVETVMEIRDASVFVDSSKEPHRLKFLLRIPEFNPKIIHLVRDGRGVAASSIRRSQWSIERAADEWRRSIASEEHILRRLPADRVMRISYENLCNDVEGHLRKLFTFLGVDPDYRVEDFRQTDHHILGNRMRMGAATEIKLDERWRQTLTPETLKVFERKAGTINRRYDYV